MSKQPTIRKQVLSGPLSDDLVCSVCECASNILKGNVPLTDKEKTRLRRYKEGLRELSHKKTPISKKKKIIQKGGFLGALLGPLVGSVILPLAKKIFT